MTTFVKAVVAGLNSHSVVTSPTFALAQFYQSDSATILHIDTYRLSGVEEYRDLALEDSVEESITIVEWGERIAEEFACHLLVDFRLDSLDANRRTLVFSSSCERWTNL